MSANPNRYVYITGCDSGFGRLATTLFAKQNVGVFSGVFLESSMEELKKENPPGMVVPLQLDVTSEASVDTCAEQIRDHLAKNNAQLVGVVNNAGILVQPCPTEWQSMKDFRDMFNVNVIGTAAVTQSVLPLIREARGRIVCVSSIAGKIGLPTQSAYCASKYAVQGYADTLRRDMMPWGVSVHIVEPGVFPNTNLYERFEKGLDVVWARLDSKIKEDYGEAHYQFVRRALSHALKELGQFNSDSSQVSKAYVDAILSDKPQYRYKVGPDSKYMITALANMHESTQDTLLTFVDPKLNFVPPAKAPKEGAAMAYNRMDQGWPRFIALMVISAYILYKIRS